MTARPSGASEGSSSDGTETKAADCGCVSFSHSGTYSRTRAHS